MSRIIQTVTLTALMPLSLSIYPSIHPLTYHIILFIHPSIYPYIHFCSLEITSDELRYSDRDSYRPDAFDNVFRQHQTGPHPSTSTSGRTSENKYMSMTT
jgi:hypothetical protein